MKEIYNQYKNEFKYFITKKGYIIPVIIIAILSYGFTITNFSVGVDDLQQNRYVTGTYLLSQGRWGQVLTARIFNNTSFVPFWSDFIATILFIFLAIILCSFIKKELGKKVDKTIYYTLFSGALLSYPLIHHIFIYNFANVITGMSNIGMILVAILIYENIFNLKNKKINILICCILPFFISMYEASCQTFLCFIFIVFFINVIKNKYINKKMFEYIANCILILVIAIILNSLINNIIYSILRNAGTLTLNYSAKGTPWLSGDIKYCITRFKTNVIDVLINDIKNVKYIGLFFIISLITIIISTVKSIKDKNLIYVILNVIIILANFSIIFIQDAVFYRTNSSWSIVFAFMILYILICLKKDKAINKIVIIVSSFIILYNSKELTSAFYNDYIRYEREKNIAYDIANTIIRTCKNPNKPLVYIPYDAGDLQGNAINYDNGWAVMSWGINAFGERGIEITTFINSLGYNLKTATNEEWKEGYKEFMNISDNYEKDFVIELDKYIIVKVINESR